MFISTIALLIKDHKWCISDYLIVLENWVTILMNLIDLSHHKRVEQLIDWIDEGHKKILFQNYEAIFNNQVS